MSEPLVFNIQRFSTHDGDGVRTTVFFKGCPLRCAWCHNPESQLRETELLLYAHKCTGCGRCASVCPQGANSISGGRAGVDRTKCIACGACAELCPNGAREIAGRAIAVRELVRELLKDRILYEQSGGGVTLSGGEPMWAAPEEFLVPLLRELRREGISVYIDTCGFVDRQVLARVLPYTDVFLYDIKAADEQTHRKWTGAPPERILENLVFLNRNGARFDLRLPLMDGANAAEEDILRVLAFLKREGIRPRKIHLLPYHDTGAGKYAALGRPYAASALRAPSGAVLEHFRKLFLAEGYGPVTIGG